MLSRAIPLAQTARLVAAGQLRRAAPASGLMVVTRGMHDYYGYVSNNATKLRPLPQNTIIKFVPQQEAWVVERFGRFNRILEPGLNFLVPIIDRVKYVQSLKEVTIEIPTQSAITHDNVTLHLDGVLYLRVLDPYKASYGVENAEYAVAQLAQTTMRSEIGKMNLDNTFKERDRLNHAIVDAMNNAIDDWGIQCLRYEIRDVTIPDDMVRAMQMQASAERRKRAQILDSEASRQSDINIAEGRRMAVVLGSEAQMEESINLARGDAQAIELRAAATAKSLSLVADAIRQAGPYGQQAVGLQVAEQYVSAFSNIAKESTTVLLPAGMSDPSSMIAQAMTIFSSLSKNPSSATPEQLAAAAATASPAAIGASATGTAPAADKKPSVRDPVAAEILQSITKS
ncbi:cell division cycle 20-like protein 1, cofactor-APC complex [Fonticula alba]|uniref:Cell division cycle 20-like protein 1, cofactor-APC complex n=1 Tax=Fonticula alba TaxID=691883 RepID=A0A058ZHH2_FONAL|nr:cell division cycle 20-like protein 1, cofactor-APC complex [Fonticula alba]KCV73411.1 cell division cycle 20-like protein 1, cofactor-APC complex [Fonticula alba]|eukprot:XP_009493112.1 cell division cycle 20-like protein 1, cofactor-APC complex [Fonticula alba]